MMAVLYSRDTLNLIAERKDMSLSEIEDHLDTSVSLHLSIYSVVDYEGYITCAVIPGASYVTSDIIDNYYTQVDDLDSTKVYANFVPNGTFGGV